MTFIEKRVIKRILIMRVEHRYRIEGLILVFNCSKTNTYIESNYLMLHTSWLHFTFIYTTVISIILLHLGKSCECWVLSLGVFSTIIESISFFIVPADLLVLDVFLYVDKLLLLGREIFFCWLSFEYIDILFN